MGDINYYCYSWGNTLSGGTIFDSNLVDALSADAAVHEHAIPTFRKWTLPVWKKRLGPIPLPRDGCVNIVSHEGLHNALDAMKVDCFVVHNYFTEFDFPKLKLINPLYRTGSDRIFSRIFSESKRVIFLSARELRLATERYPEFSERFSYSPPGHNAQSVFFDGPRNANIIEMPGTLDWLPKKLSYWLNVGYGLAGGGTLVRGDNAEAYISVVYDSFLSGFKLKLIEMAKHGKSIISFCDLQEELANIGFEDLPYKLVGSRSELDEAITHFQHKGDLSLESRRACYLRGGAITWTNIAKSVHGV